LIALIAFHQFLLPQPKNRSRAYGRAMQGLCCYNNFFVL